MHCAYVEVLRPERGKAHSRVLLALVALALGGVPVYSAFGASTSPKPRQAPTQARATQKPQSKSAAALSQGSSSSNPAAGNFKSYPAKLMIGGKGVALRGLQMDSDDVKVYLWRDQGEVRIAAYLSGAFSRDDWEMVWDDASFAVPSFVQSLGHSQGRPQGTARADAKPAPSSQPSPASPSPAKAGTAFQRMFKVSGPETTVDLVAVGPRGEIDRQRFTIRFQGWEASQVDALEVSPRTPGIRYAPAFGYSLNSYTQTDRKEFTQTAILLKASAIYTFQNTAWTGSFTGFLTAFPLSSSQPGVGVRFLGLNLRVGRSLPWIDPPFGATLSVGYYYATMMVSGDDFGFTNIGGPQLYPSFTFDMKKLGTLGAYFKVSPVSSGFAVLSLDSREIAFGLSWGFRIPGGRTIGVNLDHSNLRYVEVAGSFGQSVANTISFSTFF